MHPIKILNTPAIQPTGHCRHCVIRGHISGFIIETKEIKAFSSQSTARPKERKLQKYNLLQERVCV